MLRHLCLLAALFALIAPVPARAQSSPSPLTVERAIAEALEHNRSLQSARRSVQASEHMEAAARGAWLPRISVSETWQRGTQPVYVFSSLLASRRFTAANFAIDALTHPDATGAFHTSTGIEQTVFDGGARRADIDAARALSDIAALTEREAEALIATQVVEAFGQLLSAQSALRAANGALEHGREDLARATRRRDAGLVTEADALSVAVHVADMEQRTIQAEGQVDIIRARLNQLMGAPVDQAFEPASPDSSDDRALAPVKTLVDEATANRPELQRAVATERAADARRRAASALFMPRVTAQAGYDLSGIQIGSRAGSWIVGGDVRWTLGLGAPERARVQAAAADASRARLDVEDVRSRITVDVVTAVKRIETARAKRRVGAASVAQARESERIIRDRFDAGLLPVNDVLRAAAMLLDAQAQEAAAAVDLLTAHSDLQRALGRSPSTK